METTKGAYTIVTVPLPGRQTFFAGMAPAAQVEALAGMVRAHLDVQLPNPIPVAVPDGLSC